MYFNKFIIYTLVIFHFTYCMNVQYSPLDTSQPGFAGILSLIAPGLFEMESNSNNDSPGVSVVQSGGSTTATEGGAGDNYTVVLTSQPIANVTIAVSADAQVRVNGVASANLVFTSANWNTTQTVNVTAVDDSLSEGNHTGTINHSSFIGDNNFNGIAVGSVTVSITDNDSPGISIVESSGSTNSREGGAGDSYSVVLTFLPTSNVTIAISADAQVEVNGGASANILFTTANWNIPQSVTVTAVDDGNTEGTHTGTITHTASSVDTGYNGLTIGSVSVSITDNDFLVSSNPANNATNVPPCTGFPCRGKIILSFDQSMNTSLTPTFVTELANSNTNYVSTSNTNTGFTWSTTTFANDTLTINIGWYWFPETSKLRYTLGNLQSLAGVSSDSIQQIFTTTGSGQVFPVKDTGQTSCYTNSPTATTPCPSATFPGQDGDFTNVPTARSFTGPTPHGTFGTNFTTLDNVTGLRFASCSVGQSGAGCTGSATATTFEAGVNACSDLNIQNSGSGYWGLTNWRLPTQNELATLLNNGVTSPAIDTVSFPSTVSNPYWASGAYQNFFRAYGVNFIGGTINDGGWDVKSNTNYVRCVSAPTTVTTASYTDNNDGTISDNNTGLRWQKCSNGQTNDAACSGTALTTTWQNQLVYCDSLNLGVHANASNWRLPSSMELNSIFDVSAAINSTYFPNAAGGTYVSSTSHSFSPGRHNVFHRNNVSMPLNFKTDPNYAARCVSTGP